MILIHSLSTDHQTPAQFRGDHLRNDQQGLSQGARSSVREELRAQVGQLQPVCGSGVLLQGQQVLHLPTVVNASFLYTFVS